MRASYRTPDFGLGMSIPVFCTQRDGTCIVNQEPVYKLALSCTSVCVPGRNEHELIKIIDMKRILYIKGVYC